MRISVEVTYIQEQPRDFCAQEFLLSHVTFPLCFSEEEPSPIAPFLQ